METKKLDTSVNPELTEVTGSPDITSQPSEHNATGLVADINPAQKTSQEPESIMNRCSLQVITKMSELASTVTESLVEVSTTNRDASKDLNPCKVEDFRSEQTKSEAEEKGEDERGYDYELLDSEIEKVEMCFICNLIPRKPKKLSCCGNVFCSNCIDKEKSCPLCKTDDFKTMIDKKCERRIDDLVVHCPNHNKGCDWAGELRKVEEHLNKYPSRRNGQVKGCGHQMAPCEKCEELVMFVQMKMHLEEDCSQRIIPCEFELAGCNFRGPKNQMPEHIQCNMLQHLSLMAKSLKENKDCVGALESSNLRMQRSIRKRNLTQFFLLALVCALVVILLFYYPSRVQLIQDQIEVHTHSLLIHEDIYAALQKDMNQVIQDHREDQTHSLLIHEDIYAILQKDMILAQVIQKNLSRLKENFDMKWSKCSSQLHNLDRDLQDEILEGKINFSELRNDLQSLVDDVRELNNGFSKMYIDDSKRYMDDIIQKVKEYFFSLKII